MQWSTGEASMGQNGFGGKPATVGINNGINGICSDYGCFMRNDYSFYADYPLNLCIAGVALITWTIAHCTSVLVMVMKANIWD